MRRPTHAFAIVLTAATVSALAGVTPASGASVAQPKSGTYAGTETYDTTPLPVSLTVAKNRSRITSFTGQAQVKDGCTNHITGFEAPVGPMAISAKGKFKEVSKATDYPQPHVQVTVTGTFISRTKVRGHIAIRIGKVQGCNVSRPFTATRGAPTT